jgi:hypothetical protein
LEAEKSLPLEAAQPDFSAECKEPPARPVAADSSEAFEASLPFSSGESPLSEKISPLPAAPVHDFWPSYPSSQPSKLTSGLSYSQNLSSPGQIPSPGQSSLASDSPDLEQKPEPNPKSKRPEIRIREEEIIIAPPAFDAASALAEPFGHNFYAPAFEVESISSALNTSHLYHAQESRPEAQPDLPYSSSIEEPSLPPSPEIATAQQSLEKPPLSETISDSAESMTHQAAISADRGQSMDSPPMESLANFSLSPEYLKEALTPLVNDPIKAHLNGLAGDALSLGQPIHAHSPSESYEAESFLSLAPGHAEKDLGQKATEDKKRPEITAFQIVIGEEQENDALQSFSAYPQDIYSSLFSTGISMLEPGEETSEPMGLEEPRPSHLPAEKEVITNTHPVPGQNSAPLGQLSDIPIQNPLSLEPFAVEVIPIGGLPLDEGPIIPENTPSDFFNAPAQEELEEEVGEEIEDEVAQKPLDRALELLSKVSGLDSDPSLEAGPEERPRPEEAVSLEKQPIGLASPEGPALFDPSPLPLPSERTSSEALMEISEPLEATTENLDLFSAISPGADSPPDLSLFSDLPALSVKTEVTLPSPGAIGQWPEKGSVTEEPLAKESPAYEMPAEHLALPEVPSEGPSEEPNEEIEGLALLEADLQSDLEEELEGFLGTMLFDLPPEPDISAPLNKISREDPNPRQEHLLISSEGEEESEDLDINGHPRLGRTITLIFDGPAFQSGPIDTAPEQFAIERNFIPTHKPQADVPAPPQESPSSLDLDLSPSAAETEKQSIVNEDEDDLDDDLILLTERVSDSDYPQISSPVPSPPAPLADLADRNQNSVAKNPAPKEESKDPSPNTLKSITERFRQAINQANILSHRTKTPAPDPATLPERSPASEQTAKHGSHKPDFSGSDPKKPVDLAVDLTSHTNDDSPKNREEDITGIRARMIYIPVELRLATLEQRWIIKNSSFTLKTASLH